MNTRILAATVLAAASLLSTAAFADAKYADNNVASTTSQGLTRAEVRAQLAQARASGQLDQSLETYPSLLQRQPTPVLTRSQVRGQLSEGLVNTDNRS